MTETEETVMDLDGITQEMRRRPDEQYLLEWIADQAESLDDARAAIDAYFAAVAGDV